MRITVRNEPHETGLGRVTQGPRGFIVKVDGEDVGHIDAKRVGWGRDWRGWYWYAGSTDGRIPSKNTSGESWPTKETARDACVAYIRECLTKAGGK